MVGYRGAFGVNGTWMDTGREPAAVPAAPFAGRYDATAVAYTVVESFYAEGRGQASRDLTDADESSLMRTRAR